jgi:hypothetical protein
VAPGRFRAWTIWRTVSGRVARGSRNR